MNKTLTFSVIITSVILVSGTLGFALSNTDAFASGQGGGQDQGKGKGGHDYGACEIAKEASEDRTQNPHCEDCEIQCLIDVGELSRCLTQDPRTCVVGNQDAVDACIADNCSGT